MAETKIEWATHTWNPIVGCSRVSPGCQACYAETMAARIANAAASAIRGGQTITQKQQAYMEAVRWTGDKIGEGKALPRWSGSLIVADEKLDAPLRWRKPRTIFVNSMSDLWHERVEAEDIARVYDTMHEADWHTYQILTKRPGRRLEWLRRWNEEDECEVMPHVWEGTSIESRDRLYRLEYLRTTPAAVRFLSLEPLLEDLGTFDLAEIHWVIVGGESGPGAREMKLSWAESVVDMCKAQGVPVFVKQVGSVLARELGSKKQKGGDMDDWPSHLRIREFPLVKGYQ